MAKSFFKKIFRPWKDQGLENLKKEIEEQKRSVEKTEKMLLALAESLYAVKVYKLGPSAPNGKFEREISLSKVPATVLIPLLEKGEVVSAAGSSPASWAGTKWVLCKK